MPNKIVLKQTTKITIFWFLMTVCYIPRSICLAHPPSENLSPEAYWNKNWDPQSDMNRVKNCGTLSIKRDETVKSLLSGFREP